MAVMNWENGLYGGCEGWCDGEYELGSLIPVYMGMETEIEEVAPGQYRLVEVPGGGNLCPDCLIKWLLRYIVVFAYLRRQEFMLVVTLVCKLVDAVGCLLQLSVE
jgi:hypothetical protein